MEYNKERYQAQILVNQEKEIERDESQLFWSGIALVCVVLLVVLVVSFQ